MRAIQIVSDLSSSISTAISSIRSKTALSDLIRSLFQNRINLIPRPRIISSLATSLIAFEALACPEPSSSIASFNREQ